MAVVTIQGIQMQTESALGSKQRQAVRERLGERGQKILSREGYYIVNSAEGHAVRIYFNQEGEMIAKIVGTMKG